MDCPSARSPESSGIASRALNCFIYAVESVLVSLSTTVGLLQTHLVFSFSDLIPLKAFSHAAIASFVAVDRVLVEPIVFPPQSNRRLQIVAFAFHP